MAISRQAGSLIGLDKDESGSGETELEGRLRAYLIITPYLPPSCFTYVRTYLLSSSTKYSAAKSGLAKGVGGGPSFPPLPLSALTALPHYHLPGLLSLACLGVPVLTTIPLPYRACLPISPI
jgi:hypothetical protein